MPDDEDEKTDNLRKNKRNRGKRILARCEAVDVYGKGILMLSKIYVKCVRTDEQYGRASIDASIAIKWLIDDEPFCDNARKLLFDAKQAD